MIDTNVIILSGAFLILAVVFLYLWVRAEGRLKKEKAKRTDEEQ